MNDDDARAFLHTRLIDAPRERVFRAVVEPEHLARWWGPAGFSSTFEVCDVRPGGVWRFTLHGPDGAAYPNENVFGEIVAPERIVIEHPSESHHFTLTLTFEDEGGRTRVRWRQAFDTVAQRDSLAAIVTPANEQNLDRLEAEVRTIA